MSMHRLIALSLTLLLAWPVAAQEKAGSAKAARAVAPYLDEDVVAVVHIDLSRIDLDALVDRLAKLGDFDKEHIAKIKEEGGEKLTALRGAGIREVFVVTRMDGFPHGPWAFAVLPLSEDANDKAVIKLVDRTLHTHSARIGGAIIAGEEETIRRIRDLKPTPHPELAKAFAAVGGMAIQAVTVAPESLRRSLEETMPELPPEVGGGSIKTVTRAVSWNAIGVNLTPEMSLKVVVQTKNAAAAEELAKLANSFLDAMAKDKGIKTVFPDLAAVREMLTPKVKGNQLTLSLKDQELTTFLAPALKKVQAASRRTEGANNLKQMALAMHNYHATYKGFPAHASYDKQGQPLLSWRVHILPFVEQQALYQQFHLDEPWDSAHNKKLIAHMPAIYRSPTSKAGSGRTIYLVPVGKDTIFPPGPKGVQIREITDGASNTILIVESDDDHAVVWTRPQDLRVNAKEPLGGLAGKAVGHFLAAFADGSVRTISRTIDADTLWALFTKAGNEAIGEIP
jgi:hypothetical protein